MLIRLLRRFVPKYRTEVAIVTVLVFIQSIANLYLPNLNADIINNGVAKGDTDYIWRTGAVMLAVTLVLGVLAIVGVYFASRASMGVGRDDPGVQHGLHRRDGGQRRAARSPDEPRRLSFERPVDR